VNFRRIPISGWTKCAHDAAVFDTPQEYSVACILDASQGVLWWLRNDPPLLRIGTPAGFYEPDFVYQKTPQERSVMGVLEVKGGIFWGEPGSDARIKSEAAIQWTAAIAAAGTAPWEYALILDQDVKNCVTLGQLFQVAADSAP
jgi:hypothetical protein